MVQLKAKPAEVYIKTTEYDQEKLTKTISFSKLYNHLYLCDLLGPRRTWLIQLLFLVSTG